MKGLNTVSPKSTKNVMGAPNAYDNKPVYKVFSKYY